MSKLRTANLLGALAGEIADRIEREGKLHPNETSSATAALNVIGFYEGCSNGALSRALGLSHTATVRLVDKLELSGLVRSER
jgi:MarR family transcriptional regulator, negative regulator of the multidrug operon emrRAB